MTAIEAEKLYTPEILALAVELAEYPFDSLSPLKAEVSSRSCGSTLAMSVKTNADGAIDAIGMRVTACAIGQAAAAIFARNAKGRSLADIQRSGEALLGWLNRSGEMPQWAGIATLDNARAFPARHDAILMPWRAAVQALSKAMP